MEHSSAYGYGYWTIVITTTLIMVFIIFSVFKPKSKTDWKSLGALSAFFLALFTEMYGFPFTIYLISTWLGKRYPVIAPFAHNNGHLLKVFFGNNMALSLFVHPGTDILLIIAVGIIAKGWKKIHSAQGELVEDGIYKYIRHPQYTGFFLIIAAFLIQWPTITTLIMTPALIVLYNTLARKEEKKMLELFGDKYRDYMIKTARFFPSIKKIRNKS